MHPGARLRDVVPSAYLRVFQPLDAFDREEQLRWERYLLTNMWVPGRRQRYLDHSQDGLGLIAPADGEHAEVRVVDGRTYVSPWRMRMRVLAAALAFREAKPIELAERFLSKKDGEACRPRAQPPPPARPPRRRLLPPESRGTCPSGGSCSSRTESDGSARTSTGACGSGIARRRAERSVVRARRSPPFADRTSVRSATS